MIRYYISLLIASWFVMCLGSVGATYKLWTNNMHCTLNTRYDYLWNTYIQVTKSSVRVKTVRQVSIRGMRCKRLYLGINRFLWRLNAFLACSMVSMNTNVTNRHKILQFLQKHLNTKQHKLTAIFLVHLYSHDV